MNGQSKALINLIRGWPNPALLPTAQIKAAANKVLSDPDLSSQGLLYGPLPGNKPLRVQLAAWLTRFYKPERPIGWERICISSGASQNLACILQVFSDPIYTRNIWMVSPTYFLACRVFEDSGFHGRLKAVPEDEDGINIDYLRKGLQQSEREATAKGNTKPVYLRTRFVPFRSLGTPSLTRLTVTEASTAVEQNLPAHHLCSAYIC